jgi:hypothetical protein
MRGPLGWVASAAEASLIARLARVTTGRGGLELIGTNILMYKTARNIAAGGYASQSGGVVSGPAAVSWSCAGSQHNGGEFSAAKRVRNRGGRSGSQCVFIFMTLNLPPVARSDGGDGGNVRAARAHGEHPEYLTLPCDTFGH